MSSEIPRRPLLIDTDPGIDDALALLLAFRLPTWRVEALTTVAGNVPVEVATANVARILGVVGGGAEPVVAEGASGPRAGRLVTAPHVHGDDGLGGLGASWEPAGARPDRGSAWPPVPLRRHPRDAADLILDCARRFGADLTVVTLGPLTNLALAVERDPMALRAVGSVVVMGGAIAVGGNVTPAAEFNIFVDPESAAVVLSAGLRLTLVPLDVTREVTWVPAPAVETASDRVARFAGALAHRAVARAGAGGRAGVTMHDPLAIGVAADPSLVRTEELPLAVETAGSWTRGMTVADRRGRAHPDAGPDDGWSPCRVALGVDARRFLALYQERVCRRSA